MDRIANQRAYFETRCFKLIIVSAQQVEQVVQECYY
jgi:hypothetical protein